MAFARWATEEEIKGATKKIGINDKVEKSGITLASYDDGIYVDDSEAHNLVIGSTGSGKTQATVFPQIYLAIKAEESFIVNDIMGETYERFSGLAKKNGYKIYTINLKDTDLGNNFNPLYLPYKFYKNRKIDSAIDLVENVGHYIITEDKINNNIDPFWENSATSLFTGLAFYLFEHAKAEEININSIVNLCNYVDDLTKELNDMDKNSIIYSFLSPILLAPTDTKGSIISVLRQKLQLITTRESISRILCNNDVDLENIKNEKTAIFITGNARYSSIIVPILVSQAVDYIEIYNYRSRRLSIFLDEFEMLKPFINFTNTLSISRSLNIRFNIFVKSFLEIENTYGKENSEFIKMSFGNIIYLITNDIETLEMMSKLCGKVDNENDLVTVEDLKVLKAFEAIIISRRMHPIKSKLEPYFHFQVKDYGKVPLMPLVYNVVKIYK